MCLEGLQATKVSAPEMQEMRNGFEISHREKIYKVKKYFVQDFNEYNQWMDCFKLYERSDPFKLYEVKEKIGTVIYIYI